MVRLALVLWLVPLSAPAVECRVWLGKLSTLISLDRLRAVLPRREAPVVAPAPEQIENHRRIQSAYLELFDKLGSNVSAATLRKMAAQDDPFRVPEQKDTDLAALRKNMSLLKEMVRQTGWEDAALLPLLRNALTERAKSLEAAFVQRTQKLRPDYQAVLPEIGEKLELSPDGKFALSRAEAPPGKPAWRKEIGGPSGQVIHLLDLETGSRTSVTCEGRFNGNPLPMPNGDFLLAQDRGLVRVPQRDGKLDWPRAKLVYSSGLFGRLPEYYGYRLSQDGKYAFVHWMDGGWDSPTHRLKVIDVETGRSVGKTRTAGTLFGASWGIGATDKPSFWEVSQDGQTSKVNVVSFDPKGKAVFTPVPHLERTGGAWERIFSSADGTRIVVTNNLRAKVVEVSTGKQRDLLVVRRPDHVGLHVEVHPRHSWVGVLSKKNTFLSGEPEVRSIDWFDMESGDKISTTSLPEGEFDSFKISGDGKNLIVFQTENPTVVVTRPPEP